MSEVPPDRETQRSVESVRTKTLKLYEVRSRGGHYVGSYETRDEATRTMFEVGSGSMLFFMGALEAFLAQGVVPRQNRY